MYNSKFKISMDHHDYYCYMGKYNALVSFIQTDLFVNTLKFMSMSSEPELVYLEWSVQGTDYNLCAIASASAQNWHARHAQ